jgi:hypothetical protein
MRRSTSVGLAGKAPARTVFPGLVALGFLAAGTSPAYAYLDPGTGTIIVQAIIGSVAAGAAFVGVYWRATRSYVSRKFSRKPSVSDEPHR